jgi:hypothetical protein
VEPTGKGGFMHFSYGLPGLINGKTWKRAEFVRLQSFGPDFSIPKPRNAPMPWTLADLKGGSGRWCV